jgi:hypothetical protein
VLPSIFGCSFIRVEKIRKQRSEWSMKRQFFILTAPIAMDISD